MPSTERNLTPADVASRYGVCEQHIRNLCRQGIIPASNLAKSRRRRKWRMSEADLETFEVRRSSGDLRPKQKRQRPNPARTSFDYFEE